MKNSFSMFYSAFSICMFCVAVSLLFYIFHTIRAFDQNIANNTYQQHVISCECIGDEGA